MTEAKPGLVRALVNGVATSHVGVMDRGLMYGDGVFRTLRVAGGRPLCWSRHYRRLCSDCSRLGIAPPEASRLEGEIAVLVEEANCVLKIVITRGEGGRGYGARALTPTRILLRTPLPDHPPSYRREGVRLHLCKLRLAHQPRLAGVKHLNRLENVLARAEWSDPEVPEGLLLDEEGMVIEGTMSNLFLRRGDRLLTPDLSLCGVAGVQRERILEKAPRLGLKPEVGRFGLPELLAAEEVFVCNSIIGLWPVRALGQHPFTVGGLAAALDALLAEDDA